jgi:hypothetical protein
MKILYLFHFRYGPALRFRAALRAIGLFSAAICRSKKIFSKFFKNLHHFPPLKSIKGEGPSHFREETPKVAGSKRILDVSGGDVRRHGLSARFTRVRNRQDAEDIVQSVFLKLMKNIDRLESEEHVKAWLIKVTANEGKACSHQAGENIPSVSTTKRDRGHFRAAPRSPGTKRRPEGGFPTAERYGSLFIFSITMIFRRKRSPGCSEAVRITR